MRLILDRLPKQPGFRANFPVQLCPIDLISLIPFPTSALIPKRTTLRHTLLHPTRAIQDLVSLSPLIASGKAMRDALSEPHPVKGGTQCHAPRSLLSPLVPY